MTTRSAASALAPARNLIDGAVREPDFTDVPTFDPNTGERHGWHAETARADVEEALACADDAWAHGHGPVSSAPLVERLAGLERLAVELDRRTDAFAHVHAEETGIPISTARLFAAGLADTARGVADAAPAALATDVLDAGGRRVETLRLPWGPAALYPAWNGAAFLCVTKLAYAMATGCPAVLKPSEYAQSTTGLLVEALTDADLRPGVAQVICGGPGVGARLAQDPRIRMISYTGGTTGGRAVARAGIGRMAAMQLELSASNPAIVLAGADVAAAARRLADGMLVLNGQWCEAPRRVFVARAEHDELVAELLTALGGRRVGHALEETTDVGPLAHRRQLDGVAAAITELSRAGQRSAPDVELPDRGWFMAPTLVSDLPLDAVRAEVFGPVLAISPYDDVAAAVGAANGLEDGLAGYVFGADRDAALAVGRTLHAGEVRVNGTHVLDLADGSSQSFWGASGLGGHGRREVLRAHVGLRTVGEDDPQAAL